MATVNIPSQYQTLKTRLENVIKKVIEPQYVPNGSDLNDYIDAGMYYNGGNADVTNITNLPNNDHTAFCLFVEEMGGNAKKQTWTKQSDINSVFVRIKKWDNTWTSWKPVWEDTGWKTVSFSSGYSNYSGYTTRYRRVGKVVHLKGAFTNSNALTSSQTDVQWGSISDTSCRPSNQELFLQQGSGANKYVLGITTDGKLTWARYGTNATNTSIGKGTWFTCYATWLVD